MLLSSGPKDMMAKLARLVGRCKRPGPLPRADMSRAWWCLTLITFAWGSAGLLSCAKEPPRPRGPAQWQMPACPRGPFQEELEALLPSVEPTQPTALYPPDSLKADYEPACIVPFRTGPEDKPLPAGRVEVHVAERGSHRSELLGRGPLTIGRRSMSLMARNEAGEVRLTIELVGRHVKVAGDSRFRFDGEVPTDDGATAGWALPLDALVSALDRCDADQRLAASDEGNVVHARRDGRDLWRTRWLDGGQTTAIDTAIACSANDAVLAWRSAAGATQPLLVLVSARSRFIVTIERQARSEVDDLNDVTAPGSPRDSCPCQGTR